MENAIKGATFWILFFAFLLYWTSEKDTAKDQYIAGLEKVAAACLGEREGVLTIGDEVFFCKAVSTGIKM